MDKKVKIILEAEANLSELVSLWKVQESLLQSYRRIFISAQSVLIAVGTGVAFAIGRDLAAFFALGIIFLVVIYLLYLQIKICGLRGEAVYFARWLIIRYEKGFTVNSPLTYMNEYLNTGKYEDINVVNDVDYQQFKAPYAGREHSVRRHMNRLPWVFVVLWLLLIIMRVIMAFINIGA
ncbi:hypothetical protein ACFLUJ_05970 [Chloroflexota bacterium]